MIDIEKFLDAGGENKQSKPIVWASSDGLERAFRQWIASYPILKDFFVTLDELNDFTRIVSPGILKKVKIEWAYYVIKSTTHIDDKVQINEIARAFDIQKLLLKHVPSPITSFGFDVSIAVPQAVTVSAQGDIFSLMEYFPFPTLDGVFLSNSSDVQKIFHLKNIRRLYEFFSSHGMLWKDMAPRNILLDQSHVTPRYILLDFEKTKYIAPADFVEAESLFWKGPVISEEFASSCSLVHLREVFGDRYHLDQWDYNPLELMPNHQMRRELKDIVQKYGRSITMGEYHFLDRQLVSTREPIVTFDDEMIYPGKICFLVDHVLGPEYDRALNELYIAASLKNELVLVVKTIHNILLNAGILIRDLFCSLELKKNVKFPADEMKNAITDLYNRYVDDDWVRLGLA